MSRRSGAGAATGGIGSQKDSQMTPSQQMYLRLMGRKAIPSSLQYRSLKPAPIKDRVLGIFSNETSEERSIRFILKNYAFQLDAESKHILKSIELHRQRFTDHRNEFIAQEAKLLQWGLKHQLLRTFHQYFWSRITRSLLVKDLACELYRYVIGRSDKAAVYLRTFEETANRQSRYSVQEADIFCVQPDSLISYDDRLRSMSMQVKRLDDLCFTHSKSLADHESAYTSKSTQVRRQLLLDILHRFVDINPGGVSVEESVVAGIEGSMSWVEYNDWYSARRSAVLACVNALSDLVEDSRQKEGRLFNRWCRSVFQYDEHQHHQQKKRRKRSDSKHVPTLDADSHGTTMDNASAGGDGAINAVSDPLVHDEPSVSSLQQQSSEGVVTLPTTPLTVKAFVRYFASDVLGRQYDVPEWLTGALLSLVEMLFFRRLHAFIYQYSSAEEQRKDLRWRARCLSCRFVDPQTYDVPERYLGSGQPSTNEPPDDASPIQPAYPTDDACIVPAYTTDDVSFNPAYPTDDVSFNPAYTTDDVSFNPAYPTDDVSFNPAYTTDDVSFNPADGYDKVDDVSIYPADDVPINHIVHPASTSDIQHYSSDSALGDISTTTASITPDLPGSDAMRQHRVPCPRVICVTSTASSRFQRLFDYSDGQFGAAYARSSRVLSLVTTTSTPQEIILVLKLALNWLYRDALEASGSRELIGADLLVPLFTMVLINAHVPNIHMVFRVLKEYGDYSEQGDVSYLLANLEGSMLFIMDQGQADDDDAPADTATESLDGSSPALDMLAMEKLGEWLRDQTVMEDTITILQNEGWMA